jgi:recombination protein RecA
MADHDKLREIVNKALNRKALDGLVAPPSNRNIDGLSSGSLWLNFALSGSPLVGFAWGRMVEIFGPEQSGKTTLALHMVREAQRLELATGKEYPCLFVDAEHALDLLYARSIGIDLHNTTISQPGCGEDGLNEVEAAVKAGFKLIIVDSVAALTPRAELEGEMGEAHIGLQARLMSQALRKLTGLVSKSGAIIVFLNQLRMKIGVMFGNPETTTGGNALKFYASYRLDVRAPRSGKKSGKTLMGYGDTQESVELGITANIKVVKNKLYPPHRQASVAIEYGKGIDSINDIVTFLTFAGAFGDKGLVLPSMPKKPVTARTLPKLLADPAVMLEVMGVLKQLEVPGDSDI